MKPISITNLGLIFGLFLLCLGAVDACDRFCYDCANCTAEINAASEGEVICLTRNITDFWGICIDNPTNFNNKIFDCQGNIIDGAVLWEWQGWWRASSGIYLYNRSGNTIRNCIITDFYFGISLHSSSNNLLTNNTANSNRNGISLHSSSNNLLTNNTANSNRNGISLHSSSNNLLTNNTVNDNIEWHVWYKGCGIYLQRSSNNILTNNTANNNSYGIYFDYVNDNNTMISNNICYNSRYDVHVYNLNSATGDNNTCVIYHNYNDANSTGCKYFCPIDSCDCSTCGECNYKP